MAGGSFELWLELPSRSRYFRQGRSGMLMLKRTDWRSFQWTEDAASEPIQLELSLVTTEARYKAKQQNRQ
jgi:hypothetical protein